jgi:hypothetical protein
LNADDQTFGKIGRQHCESIDTTSRQNDLEFTRDRPEIGAIRRVAAHLEPRCWRADNHRANHQGRHRD